MLPSSIARLLVVAVRVCRTETVDAVAWQSLGFPSGEGPHVSIEGVYQGHEVFVQVLAYAPEDEEPGMKLDTTRGNPQ